MARRIDAPESFTAAATVIPARRASGATSQFSSRRVYARTVTRPDASMSLLRDLERDALDPGYVAAAEARRAGTGRPRRTLTHAAVGAAAALIGLLLVTSALMLTRDAQGRTDALAEQIRVRQDENEVRAAEVEDDRRSVTQLRSDLLTGTGRDDLAAQARALEVAAGTVALAGPGVRVTLDDGPGPDAAVGADPRGGATDTGRVVGRDLQQVTNALWAAGAEAVAVNDQRLTATSAIRDAGEAILVGFRPLARPYTVVALGGDDLAARFEDGPGQAYLGELRAAFGVDAQTTIETNLTVPAASATEPRHARVGAGDGPAATTATPAGAAAASAPHVLAPGADPRRGDAGRAA